MGHHPLIQPPIQEATNAATNSGATPLTAFLIIIGLAAVGIAVYYWFNKK